MSLELWTAFALASAILLIVPGPTVMLVVSYALGRGRETAWATVPGVALGDLTSMVISLAGAGAVLATSATLFTALKLFGAAYLVWLGIRLWHAPAEGFAVGLAKRPKEAQRMFWNAYLVTALNPKSIVFFVAFVPQFLVADAPLAPQCAVLVATFLGVALVTNLLWVFFAGAMRSPLQRVGTLRLINRLGGGFLVGAGMLTALARRTG